MKNLNLIARPNYIHPQMTHTRASTGTYVNSIGLIATAPANQLRYEYDPTTLAGNGWLIEESRTNLSIYSEQFEGSTVWGISYATISANSVVAPDGNTTADQMLETTTNGLHQMWAGNGPATITAGSIVTFSIFVKGIGRTSFELGLPSTSQSNFFRCQYDLSTCTTIPVGSVGSAVLLNSSIKAYPNGWFRVSMTGTIDNITTACYPYIYILNGGSNQYAGNTSCGLALWGCQTEIGSFASSYIPTTSAAVTRSQDVLTAKGLTGNHDSRSYFIDFTYFGPNKAAPFQDMILWVDNGTTNTVDLMWINQYSGSIRTRMYNNGMVLDTYSPGVFSNGSRCKFMASYDKHGITTYLNGALSTSQVSKSTYPIQNHKVYIFATSSGTTPISGYLKQLTIFDKSQTGEYACNATKLNSETMPTPMVNFVAKDGVVPPQLTITRASTATYTDRNGLIKTAPTNTLRHDYDPSKMGIVTNYCLYSEQFDTASYWTPGGASITANSTYAPDGTTNADAFFETAITGQHAINSMPLSIVPNTPYTASIYVKDNGRTFGEIMYANNAFSQNVNVRWNLTSGTITSTNFGGGTTVLNKGIINIGNGWYRVFVTAIVDSTSTSAYMMIYTSNTLNSFNYAGDVTKGIYIWGAQFEKGDTLGIYTPTTTTPTSTVAALNDSYRGWLIEDSRTNLNTYSEQINDSSYNVANGNAFGSGSIVDATIAPDGNMTADFLCENSGQNSGHWMYKTVYGLTSSNTYTLSGFFKAKQHPWMSLYFTDSGWSGSNGQIYVNLLTGAIGTTTVGGAMTNFSYGAKLYANGWVRVWITGQLNGSYTSANIAWFMCNVDGSTTYIGDGASGMYVWGIQLEQGQFPTSYIPTTSSSVTRPADVVTSPLSVLPFKYDAPSGGTLYVEADSMGIIANNEAYVSLNSGGWDFLRLYTPTGGYVQLHIYDNGHGVNITSSNTNQGQILPGVPFKSAGAYSYASSIGCVNGKLPSGGNIANVLIPYGADALTTLNIGSAFTGTQWMNGHIRRVCLWNTRLANNILQKITR